MVMGMGWDGIGIGVERNWNGVENGIGIGMRWDETGW